MTVKPEISNSTENNAPQQVIDDKKPQDASSPPPQETQEQINWRKFREERKKEREEKDIISKRAAEKEAEAAALKAAMEAMLDKPSPKQDEEAEEDDQKRISRLVNEEINRRQSQNIEEMKKKEAKELPQKLTSTFPDYYKVCTQENLDYFEYHHPEMAKGLAHMPDGFDKWSTIYQAVKKYIPNPNTDKEDKRIEKNSMKPKSVSAGLSTTGDQAPVYLDENKKSANWERMQRVMKGG